MADQRRAMIAKGLLEIALISVGVFLGLAAEQWRSNAQHREQAHAALLRFRTEIEHNRAAVEKVKDYHVQMRDVIGRYLDPKTRAATNLQMEGVMPAVFEHTAWDLAIATQALADIDQALAFELARVYGLQQQYSGLSDGLTQAMYLRPPSENLDGFLHSVRVYYDDVVVHEPALLDLYAHVLPLIDGALKD
jgi:hypothetical protein